ncbi:uncharacterized protein LOC132637094 [Lycium barbarum]|uniref:uncharacterized protein LOC132637094 n=1 Tax=Lycium barbarum TaxID=112863 RepID=UPI00293F7991|nr:uncharacterized protein LOC132637094 [Lycium barbarum]
MAIETTNANSSSSTNPNTNTNPSIDPSDPLYLHPSNTPGTVSVSVPFARIGYGEWKEERYGVANTSQYFSLQRAINSTTQGSSDVETYFTRLKGLRDDLGTCSLGRPCTCGAMHEFFQGQNLVQFLSGLNDIYSTVRSNILMMNPVTIVGQAYAMLIRDEKQREIQHESPGSSSFHVGSSSSSPFNGFSPGSSSFHIGSSSSNPFSGLLPGSSFHVGSNSSSASPDFKFTRNRKSTACAQIDSPEQPTGPNMHSDDNPHGFSREQYAHILNLFQQIQPPSHASNPTSANNPTFAGLVHSTIFNGPSLKRPLEIGKVEHGLYILHLPHVPTSASVPSITVASTTDCFSIPTISADVCSIDFTTDSSSIFHIDDSTLRTDNAFELGSSSSHATYLASLGIQHQTTYSHTPQQNGAVDRKCKHILETARALLFQSKLPIKYWGECILTATYLVNRFPSSSLSNKSPYEVLHGVSPTYHHLRSFGCLAYATVPILHRDKFQSRVIPSIFIIYQFGKWATNYLICIPNPFSIPEMCPLLNTCFLQPPPPLLSFLSLSFH